MYSGVKEAAPNQNLNCIYASVEKKSAQQNKLSGAPYRADVPDASRPPMNIHDPASVSDNTGTRTIAPSHTTCVLRLVCSWSYLISHH